MNLIISGSLPDIPSLHASALIALEKPEGRGVRPIAIGEVCVRLASLCAMAACQDAGPALALQLGVSVPGFAAAARDASKRRAYRQVSSALAFVPMSVGSFGRLGAPALTLLRDLADQAVQAGEPGLSRAAFISGALRELTVALCRGNASLCRSGAYVVTRAAGRTPMRGLARPSAVVV
jgi:hypothetical protein